MERPVGKKVTSVHPLAGVLDLFRATTKALQYPEGEKERREKALTEELDGIVVDTCFTEDTGLWETDIKRESMEGKWVIVSQYVDEKEAREEHKKWVELMKEEPGCELKDIDSWNLESLKEETSG